MGPGIVPAHAPLASESVGTVPRLVLADGGVRDHRLDQIARGTGGSPSPWLRGASLRIAHGARALHALIAVLSVGASPDSIDPGVVPRGSTRRWLASETP